MLYLLVFFSCMKDAKFIMKADDNSIKSNSLDLAIKEGNKEKVKELVIGSEEKKEEAIKLAIENNNLDMVELVISFGIDLNKKLPSSLLTPLMFSSLLGHKEIVKFLIDKGVDIEKRTEDGWSALIFAYHRSHEEVKKLLLENGKIDSLDEEGKTNLMLAVEEEDVNLVKFLIKNGADQNLENRDGKTALIIACEYENKDIVEILIQKMELINEKQLDKALYVAVDKDDTEIVMKILNLFPVEEIEKKLCLKYYKETILDRAIKSKSARVMIDLIKLKEEHKISNLEENSSFKVQTEMNIMSLLDKMSKLIEIFIKEKSYEENRLKIILSEEERRESIVFKLIKEILSINKVEGLDTEAIFNKLISKNEDEILILASYLGDELIIKKYLNTNKVDTRDENRATLIMLASYIGHKEIVEILIKKEATIGLSSREGLTALHLAAHNGHIEIVKMLIKNGADIHLNTKEGASAMTIALENDHENVAEFLFEKESGITLEKSGEKNYLLLLMSAALSGNIKKLETIKNEDLLFNSLKDSGLFSFFLYQASYRGHKEFIKLLLEKGANVNSSQTDGRTSLHIASINGRKELVNLLLEKGAGIDLADKDGCTPLYLASQEGHKEVVELLLMKGANINLSNKEGETPLFVSSHEGYIEVVDILIKNKATVDLANNNSHTPLLSASINGHKEIARLLVREGAKIKVFDLLPNTSIFPESICKYSKDELINDIIFSSSSDYAWEQEGVIPNSSCCFTSGILSEIADIDTYIKLSSFLPSPFMLDNFSLIPSMNFYRYSALHFSVMKSDTDSLKRLLSNNNISIFVNSNDNLKFEKCLDLAIKLNRIEHIKILLSFGACPIYFRFPFLIPKPLSVLDIPEIKEYVTNKMILDVLKEDRSADAGKMLLNSFEKHILWNSTLVNYKDIINLKATDEEGNNVFHYLALYTLDELDLSHFFNKCYELPSFVKELMFAYNNAGITPFHYALKKSNEHFVEYFLVNENISKEAVIKPTKDGESIFNLVEKESISKSVITLLIKHLWSNEDIEAFYESAKVDEIDKNMYRLVKESASENKSISDDAFDDLNLCERALIRAIHLSIVLNAHKCLKVILTKIPREKAEELVTFALLSKLVLENKKEILEVIISLDEDKLLEKDKDGNTLLHLACLNNKNEIVKNLLEYEIIIKNINVQNKDGNTAMHNAHIAFSPSLISIIKEEAKADVNIRNQNGKRAIDLLRDVYTDSKKESVIIGTIYAALCALLNKKYDAEEYKCTLHLAVLAKEELIIGDFSLYGLINELDEDENTALHLAIRDDQRNMIKALLERGANFSKKNKFSETPLHLVKSKEALILLINEALNRSITSEYLLNIQNEQGNTLLHAVAERIEIKQKLEIKDKQLIETLLDSGANRDKVNKAGKSVIDLVDRNKELRKLILKYSPNLSAMKNREMIYFKEQEDKRKGRDKQEEDELLEVLNGKRKHDKDLCTKRRAIHVVVERNDGHALEMLMEKGSDPKWIDNKGKNCYEISINNLNLDVFKILVKNGYLTLKKDDEFNLISLVFGKGINFFNGQFCEIIFSKIEKQYSSNTFYFNEMRKSKNDPIIKLIEKNYDFNILKKLIEIGLKVVEGENNLLIEAIISKRKELFNYLISKVDDKEVFYKEYKGKTAIKEAELIEKQDSHYLKIMKERD